MSKETNRGPGIKCPECGAMLDYGEQCDCERRKSEDREEKRRHNRLDAVAKNVESYERGVEEYLYA